MKTRTVMAWSGGKDSAVALHRLQQDARYEVTGLLTTLTEGYNRISMHGVREELLRAQADALGLKLYPVWIPQACINPVYEAAMRDAIDRIKADGVTAIAHGDLFLEDVRRYRERMLAGSGIQPLFPLWGEDTAQLSRWVIANGFRATIVSVDPSQVPASLAGREYDDALLDDLPPTADPCAENGEFHTFVHEAPNFRAPIPVTCGEIVERDGFVFADLLPAPASTPV
jgi:uncharacterized protein (TIGR00290 family)